MLLDLGWIDAALWRCAPVWRANDRHLGYRINFFLRLDAQLMGCVQMVFCLCFEEG